MKSIVTSTLMVILLLANCIPSFASVFVFTGGSSNGASLSGAKGPAGINKQLTLSKSGGSISSAKAKAKFTREQVKLGNSVKAKRTPGDPIFTHVDANSVFAGLATFISDDGNPVEDFTIGLDVKGNLKCTSGAEDEFFSLAQVGVELGIDDTTKFTGTATQDGTGAFFDSGDLTGQFETGANIASIDKQFPINLGTLVDGQMLVFIFYGTTLVSFGEEIPIDFCSADFFRTSSFKPLPAQKGKVELKEGVKVTVDYVDDDLNVVSGNEKLLLESSNSEILNNVKPGSIKIIFPTTITYEAEAGPVGDANSNGTSDVELTSENTQSINQLIAGRSTNNLIVVGETTTGIVFYGVLDVTKT